MLCESYASVVHVMPFLSVVHFIGTWCMAHIRRGTGMSMRMACMHIFSRPLPIRYGGTGAGTGVLRVRAGAGDGLLHGITAGILRGILHGIHLGIRLTGMVVTGAVIGVATGARDGIITIIRTGQAIIVPDIQTIVRRDMQDILLPDGAMLA